MYGRTNGRTDTAWRQRPRGNEYKPMKFFHVIFIKPFIIVAPRTRTAEMHKHNKLEAVTCHGMMQLLRFRTTPSSNSTCMLVSCIYQVSCLHLQLLQRYRDSEILLTRRNKLGLQTPAKILASRNHAVTYTVVHASDATRRSRTIFWFVDRHRQTNSCSKTQ